MTPYRRGAPGRRMVLGLILAAGLAAPGAGDACAGAGGERTDGTLQVGETAPDFELSTQDGTTRRLSDARGKKALVLVFYRGGW